MSHCPECRSKKLLNYGMEQARLAGTDNVILTTKYACKKCGCRFSERQITVWLAEIEMHGDRCPKCGSETKLKINAPETAKLLGYQCESCRYQWQREASIN